MRFYEIESMPFSDHSFALLICTSNVLIHDNISIGELLFIVNSQAFWYVMFRKVYNLKDCIIFYYKEKNDLFSKKLISGWESLISVL